MMSLAAFWDRLNAHDWFYHMSDDRRTYAAGDKDRSEIERLARQSGDHEKLFKAFHAYHFSGNAFGTAQQPKPERPNL